MLPIHDALPPLLSALEGGNAAVLVAPPGAGKTTVTPLAKRPSARRNSSLLIIKIS